MGLFDKVKNLGKTANSDDSLSSITSEKAGEVIKKLSGKGSGFSKKLPDNLVVFTNAVGGAGASTIAVNVAYTANKMGLKVLVMDLNFLLPVQHIYFNIMQEIEKPDIVGYLLGKNNLGSAIYQSNGMSVMFANNRGLMDYINCESDQAVDNFKKAIEGLRGLYDLIIIDSPMRVDNSICNYAMYLADQIYLVWDDGMSSIANTEKIRRNMASTGIEAYTKLKVIMNKRTNIQYSKYPFEKLNIEMLACLPFEQEVIASSLSSQIFCDKAATNSKNASYFCGGIEELTKRIIKLGGYIE